MVHFANVKNLALNVKFAGRGGVDIRRQDDSNDVRLQEREADRA